MAETMKAFVFLGVGKVGIIEKPLPEPGPRDAVIRTTASFIGEVEEQLLKHHATHAITLLLAKRFFLVSGASRSIHGPFAHEQAVTLSQQ